MLEEEYHQDETLEEQKINCRVSRIAESTYKIMYHEGNLEFTEG